MESFGFCKDQIFELETRIPWLQSCQPTEGVLNQERSLQDELNEWLFKQEVLWRQKSRETWLTAGDRNSKFFHALIIMNQRKIFIATLKNNNGEWL